MQTPWSGKFGNYNVQFNIVTAPDCAPSNSYKNVVIGSIGGDPRPNTQGSQATTGAFQDERQARRSAETRLHRFDALGL
jgi:hypothetical protein